MCHVYVFHSDCWLYLCSFPDYDLAYRFCCRLENIGIFTENIKVEFD